MIGYVKFILLFVISIIIYYLLKLITVSVSKVENNYSNLAMFSILTVLINNAYTYVFNGLLFIVNSILINTFSINNIDGGNKEIFKWFEYYLSKKLDDKQIYSISNTISGANSHNQIWFNEENSDGLTQTKFMVGESYSLMLCEDSIMPIIIYITKQSAQSCGWNKIVIPKYITMYSLFPIFRKNLIWERIVNDARDLYKNDTNKYQKIYINSNYQWELQTLSNKYNLSNGIFAMTPQMNDIAEHIKFFISNENKKIRREKCFNNAYRMCIYGPPGTGKSNIITRIAGEFDLPLYYLTLPIHIDIFQELFRDVKRGIIVIEEIDKFIYEINNIKSKKNADIIKNKVSEYKNELPSLATWHNILDNTHGSQLIIYMTTNNYDLLKELNHGSLLRPERIDFIMHMDDIVSIDFVNEILNKYFDTKNEKYIDFPTPTVKITPAEITNIIKEYHNKEIIINKIKSKIKIDIELTENYPYEEIMVFISELIKSSGIIMSENFCQKFIDSLKKNKINSVYDIMCLIKQADYLKNILKSNKFDILDEIKFCQIIDNHNKLS